jgi:hypothetical protein
MKVAEEVRFELTRPFGPPVFKTGAINRSATPSGEMQSAKSVPLLRTRANLTPVAALYERGECVGGHRYSTI